MSLQHSPRIITGGIVLGLDAANIIALSANTAYAPRIALTNVPTASAGLGSGFIWRCTNK